MTKINITLIIIALVIFLSFSIFKSEDKEAEPITTVWPQTCEMCGTKWDVYSKDPHPKTIEWCIEDGSVCDIGFSIIQDTFEDGETEENKRNWLNHCLECKGCRYSFYEPEDWKKLTDSIEKIREKDGNDI